MKILHTHWMLCLTLFSVAGLLMLVGGCPPPPGDTGGDTAGGDTSGGDTSGGDGTGGDTSGGDTSGGDGAGGDTTGGDSGGGTSGGDTGGGDTGGGDSGGEGDTGGGSGGSGGSSGGSGGGGETPPTPPTKVTLSMIAKTGDAAPGQAAGTTFTKFGNPVIDSKGRVAFWGLYEGTSAVGDAGLYVWDGTEVKLVVHDDASTAGIVPGRSTSDYFGSAAAFDPREYDLAWGGGDRLLFISDIAGEKPTKGVYRWRATDGNLARVAEREQIGNLFPDIAGTADNPVIDATFHLPGVSDTGVGILGVDYLYISTANAFISGHGIFSSDGTTVKTVAEDTTKTAGVVPDQAADAYFVATGFVATINASGDALLQSRYASSAAGGRGAYLRRGDKLYRVIDTRSGASWDGLPAGAQVGQDEMRLAIGPVGHIAIDTTLTVGSATDEAVIIWNWDDGEWTELTGPGGQPATALVSGVNDDGQVLLLSGGDPYVVSAAGRVQVNATLPAELQSAVLKWSDGGGAINNHWRAVVPYTNSDKVGLAYWTGAELLVVADVTLDEPTGIAAIDTIAGSERDRPGRSGLLNDADELVFRATMNDDSEVIYLATGE